MKSNLEESKVNQKINVVYSRANLNTGNGESYEESVVSSDKDSDFDFFMNDESKIEYPKSSNKPELNHSNYLGTNIYSEYEQKLYSVQALD